MRHRLEYALVWLLVTPSLRMLERFPETTNPGYFVIKLALWILAGLILLQTVIDLARPQASAR